MTDERAVAEHYGNVDLMARILGGLEAAGADLEHLRPDDLAPVDEFHLGGRKATEYALAKMSLSPDQHVLDVGCGIGGAARYIATQTGCRVTGIDLTPEFIAVARELSERTGLGGKTTFEVGSALAMPFGDESFDAAVTFHVAMNIHDRAALYGEIARVMKPGAMLCIYDVMKKGDGDLAFPVPWAHSPETSHLTTPDEMLPLLGAAGFEVDSVEDRGEFALGISRSGRSTAGDAPAPLGIYLIMGPDAPERLRNSTRNLEAGVVAPVLIIARRGGK